MLGAIFMRGYTGPLRFVASGSSVSPSYKQSTNNQSANPSIDGRVAGNFEQRALTPSRALRALYACSAVSYVTQPIRVHDFLGLGFESVKRTTLQFGTDSRASRNASLDMVTGTTLMNRVASRSSLAPLVLLLLLLVVVAGAAGVVAAALVVAGAASVVELASVDSVASPSVAVDELVVLEEVDVVEAIATQR